MTSDVTLGLAFIAGIISFVSPCVLPLVPAYVGYMGGRIAHQATSVEPQGQSFRQRFGTLIHGLFFVLGFTLFFVVFGLLTTAAVSSLTSLGVTEGEVRDGIARIGGTAVILFGLHIMGLLNRFFTWAFTQAARLDKNPYGNVISALMALALIGITYWMFVGSWFATLVMVLIFTQLFHDALKADMPGEFWTRVIVRIQTALYVDTRRQNQPKSQYGYLGSMFMGVVFSAGWTPCIGPIYGAVLTLASSGGSVSEAGTLLTAYSLGLGIPFLLTALALDQAQGVLRRLQRNMHMIEVFSGVFLIVIGALVFSGQLQRLSNVGSGDGAFGDLSLNLENCTIAVTEGRVGLGNWDDCVSGDGVKEDFYIAYPKGTPAVVAETLSVPSLDAGAASQQAESPLTVPNLADEVPEGLSVGQRAPDFTATTLDGQTVHLSDYRGKTVLLNFWATWCGPCREEMPDFQSIYDLHQSDGFVVLAVNNQEAPDAVADFVNDLGLTFPVALDESGTVNGSLYGIQGYPSSFLIDENGVIVERFPGVLSGAQLLDSLTRLFATNQDA